MFKSVRFYCQNCGYQKNRSGTKKQVLECHGYRNKAIADTAFFENEMEDTKGVQPAGNHDNQNKKDIQHEKALNSVHNIDIANAFCEKCGTMLVVKQYSLQPIFSGTSRSCIHGKAGFDENVIQPFYLHSMCKHCGKESWQWNKEGRVHWQCMGYVTDIRKIVKKALQGFFLQRNSSKYLGNDDAFTFSENQQWMSTDLQ